MGSWKRRGAIKGHYAELCDTEELRMPLFPYSTIIRYALVVGVSFFCGWTIANKSLHGSLDREVNKSSQLLKTFNEKISAYDQELHAKNEKINVLDAAKKDNETELLALKEKFKSLPAYKKPGPVTETPAQIIDTLQKDYKFHLKPDGLPTNELGDLFIRLKDAAQIDPLNKKLATCEELVDSLEESKKILESQVQEYKGIEITRDAQFKLYASKSVTEENLRLNLQKQLKIEKPKRILYFIGGAALGYFATKK